MKTEATLVFDIAPRCIVSSKGTKVPRSDEKFRYVRGSSRSLLTKPQNHITVRTCKMYRADVRRMDNLERRLHWQERDHRLAPFVSLRYFTGIKYGVEMVKRVRTREVTGSGLYFGESGDASVTFFNSNGNPASAFGSDANGNGFLAALSESGLQIGTLSAGPEGNGTLTISAGKFRAFVDESGNGAAETLAKDGSVRWTSEMTTKKTGSKRLLGGLDGDVDFQDFLTFAANFGKFSGSQGRIVV